MGKISKNFSHLTPEYKNKEVKMK